MTYPFNSSAAHDVSPTDKRNTKPQKHCQDCNVKMFRGRIRCWDCTEKIRRAAESARRQQRKAEGASA